MELATDTSTRLDQLERGSFAMQESIKRDTQAKFKNMREEFSEKLQAQDRKIVDVIEKSDNLEGKITDMATKIEKQGK